MATVGDEVKDAIEGHEFGLPFTIERNYAEFSIELEDVTPLKIDVCAFRHASAEMETRGAIEYETETDICIRKKFPPSANDPDQRIAQEEIDRLVEFTEDIHEFLVAEALGDARWSDAKLLWCPNKKHLRGRQFTSLIRVTHLTSKAIP